MALWHVADNCSPTPHYTSLLHKGTVVKRRFRVHPDVKRPTRRLAVGTGKTGWGTICADTGEVPRPAQAGIHFCGKPVYQALSETGQLTKPDALDQFTRSVAYISASCTRSETL